MDVLSDILKSVRLSGAMYLEGEFTAPWCVRGECGLPEVRDRLAGAEHVAFFHYLTEGRCKVRMIGGGPALEAAAGDVLFFPQEGKHLLGSDLHLAPMENDASVTARAGVEPRLYRMRHGGGGTRTRFVCGYLALDRGLFRSLFQALPPLLHIRVADEGTSGLLRELLRAAVSESALQRPGSASALAKLADLIFVEALRRYVASLPAHGTGWIAGLRDPRVARALALLHAQPHRLWTVDELAKEVALSRSALAKRFASRVGQSPMQYLIRWRLNLAAQWLRTGPEPVMTIAERSGYESEATFSRAFKREFGLPPALWRRTENLQASRQERQS
jgi:AraC-like DNA-binding protein